MLDVLHFSRASLTPSTQRTRFINLMAARMAKCPCVQEGQDHQTQGDQGTLCIILNLFSLEDDKQEEWNMFPQPRKAPPIFPASSHLSCCPGQHCRLEVPSSPLLPMASHVDSTPMNWAGKEPVGKKVERVSTGRKMELLIQSGFFYSCSSIQIFTCKLSAYTHFLTPPRQN